MSDAKELLLNAAESGDLEGVKDAIEKGADIRATDEWMKQTALHKASSQGYVEIVEYLIEKGADLLAVDAVDMTPLHLAARDGRTSVVKRLLELADDIPERVLNDAKHVGTMSVTGNPIIVKMIEDYRVQSVKPSIEEDGSADDALLKAAHDGDLEGVEEALKLGANAEAVDGRGMKSIHWAALRGHRDIVLALLDNGADVNGRNTAEWSPIMHASMEGHLDIVKLLVERHADVNAKTFVSGTALMFSSGNGHEKVVRELLAAGADPSIEITGTEEEDGYTALTYALQYGQPHIVEILRALENDKGS